MPYPTRIICLYIAVAAAFACGKEAPKPTPVALTPFEEALSFGEVYPMADGNAYISSFRSPIYYVANGVASMVVGLPPEISGDITALANGTALYVPAIARPPRIYWLRGNTASLVTEGLQQQTSAHRPLSGEGFLFAENQRLRRELAEASNELAAMEEGYEPDYEQEY